MSIRATSTFEITTWEETAYDETAEYHHDEQGATFTLDYDFE